MALGSAVETTDLIRFLLKVGVISDDEGEVLESESRRAQSLILALLRKAEQ